MTGRYLVRLLKQIRKPLGIEIYRPIVSVVKKQEERVLSEDYLTFLKDVYRSQFLEVCIVEPLAKTRLEFFESDALLYDLAGRVASIHEAEKSHLVLVLALLEMSDRQDLGWQFFAEFPTHRNVGAILPSPGPKKFSLFLAVFQKSEHCSKVFVSSTALCVLSSALADGLIPVDFNADFLARLVSLRRFEEVDEYSLSLPKSHRIHSLSREQYQDIVYGLNLGPVRPIRVAFLFHDLDSRDVHDPFNCDLLGKYSISQYAALGYDVAAIPLINSIANRYVSPAHVALLLKATANLHKYCGTAMCDHFPIFQLFPSKKDGLVFR
jgi:hypothetical protein